MFKKTIIGIMLLALGNLILAGCTKTVKLYLHETGSVTKVQIAGVVLESDEEVTFNELGGWYNPFARQVFGTMENGEIFHQNLDRLKYVKIVNFEAADPMPMTMEPDYFKGHYKEQTYMGITEVVTKQGASMKFWDRSGRIDAINNVVVGTSKDGQTVKVAFEDVDHMRIKKPDPVKSALLFIGVVGLTVGIVGLVDLLNGYQM